MYRNNSCSCLVFCSSSQEFECGVSVAGSDKQEWSFTLYDFDGRGNITKDVWLLFFLQIKAFSQ